MLDDIDHHADQWALACIAWEMLLGRCPFVADEAAALLYQIINLDPHPLAPECQACRRPWRRCCGGRCAKSRRSDSRRCENSRASLKPPHSAGRRCDTGAGDGVINRAADERDHRIRRDAGSADTRAHPTRRLIATDARKLEVGASQTGSGSVQAIVASMRGWRPR